MAEVSLIFPHQLYHVNAALDKSRSVIMIEDDLFFGQYTFHLQKIAFHRASMKHHQDWLKNQGFTVRYHDHRGGDTLRSAIEEFKSEGVRKLFVLHPEDYLLERRLKRFCAEHEIQLELVDCPGFICSRRYVNDYFEGSKKYFLNNFYIDQRKRFDILVEGGLPVGGKWSYDMENRKKMPSSVSVPAQPTFQSSEIRKEACLYARKQFPGGYGKLDDIRYPITRDEALRSFESFLAQRFMSYGIYQDAIVANDSFLFHSVLTPALNVGLLLPQEVIDRSLEFAIAHKIPLNALEGFIRQVLGWREYIRALYILEGVPQRTTNHFNHTTQLSKKFWNGETGIAPVDNVINKVMDTAYANHIERLMVMGNFMLLCEIHPDEIYRWFMELFIDAYDWVMVPNVYGMSQYAAGGMMSTKPYISSSNYILKMSDYQKGEWCVVWDALYWCFIEKHREAFVRNPRMSMMVNMLSKIDKQKLTAMRRVKARFIEQLG
jgi:deoxyribodipyrimidine photolyase-related protein